MASIWDTIWDSILDDMNEIMIYVNTLLSNDRIIYWTIRNLAWALWSGPVIIWWMILVLYFQHVVQNIRFDPLTLVITWILFFLSPPQWSSDIPHPTERTSFVVDDIFSAWNLLLGPVFLFSLIQTAKNRRQLAKDISDFLAMNLDLDAPFNDAEESSRSGDSDPIRPNSPQPEDTQAEINEPEINPLLDDSDESENNMPAPKPSRLRDRFLRNNTRPPFFPGKNSQPYIRIEPRKKNTTCDQGTQTPPVNWRAYLREHYEPALQETDNDNAPKPPPSDEHNAFTRRNVSNASFPVGEGSYNDETLTTETSMPAVVSNIESLSESPSDENHAVTTSNASNASLHAQEGSFNDETLAVETSMLAVVSDIESVSESEPTREEEMLSNSAPVVGSSAEKPQEETRSPQDEVFDQNEPENDEPTQQVVPPMVGTLLFTPAPVVTQSPAAVTERLEVSEPQDQAFDQNKPESDEPTQKVAQPMVKTPAFTHAPVVAQSLEASESQQAVSKSPEVLEPQDEVSNQKRPENDEPTQQVAPSIVGTSSSIYAPVFTESSKFSELPWALKPNNEAQTPNLTSKFGTPSINAPVVPSPFQTFLSNNKVAGIYNPFASSPSKNAPAVSFSSGSSLLNNASAMPTPSQSSLSYKPQVVHSPFERSILNQAQSAHNPFASPVPNPFLKPIPNTDSPDGSDEQSTDESISDVEMEMTSPPAEEDLTDSDGLEADGTGVNDPESIGSDASGSASDDFDLEDVPLPTTPTLPARNDSPTSPYEPPEDEDISDSDNNAEDEDIYDCSVAGDIPEEEGDIHESPTSPYEPPEDEDISDSDNNAEDEDTNDCSVAGDIPVDNDVDMTDDIIPSIDEFLLLAEPNTSFNSEGLALSGSYNAGLDDLVEEGIRYLQDNNMEFNSDARTVGMDLEDTEMGEAAVEENHAIAENTMDIPMEISHTQETEMANPVNINTTVPGLGSSIFSSPHRLLPFGTPVAESHLMTQGNDRSMFTNTENDLEMTDCPSTPPNTASENPVNFPSFRFPELDRSSQDNREMTEDEELERDLRAAFESNEETFPQDPNLFFTFRGGFDMPPDPNVPDVPQGVVYAESSPDISKDATPAEILARPKLAPKSRRGATMNLGPVTQAAPPPQAAPAKEGKGKEPEWANDANHGLLHLAQAAGIQVAGSAAPNLQPPRLRTVPSGNTGSLPLFKWPGTRGSEQPQPDSMESLEAITQDAEILDTEPESQTPMNKGGLLFPGGNAMTPVPAISVTTTGEQPQPNVDVPPVKIGGL